MRHYGETGKPDFVWTDAAVGRLKALWAEGLSCSQIAKEIGGDLTRNSVIGKVHRLKLKGRASKVSRSRASYPKQRKLKKPAPVAKLPTIAMLPPAAPRPRAVPAVNVRTAKERRENIRPQGTTFERRRLDPALIIAPPLAPVAEAIPSLPVSVLDHREGQCRWPLWSHREKATAHSLYCGAGVVDEGKPYCTHHRDVSRGIIRPALDQAA